MFVKIASLLHFYQGQLRNRNCFFLLFLPKNFGIKIKLTGVCTHFQNNNQFEYVAARYAASVQHWPSTFIRNYLYLASPFNKLINWPSLTSTPTFYVIFFLYTSVSPVARCRLPIHIGSPQLARKKY